MQVDLEPFFSGQIGKILFRQLATCRQTTRSTISNLACQEFFHTLIYAIFHDPELIIQVLSDLIQFSFLNFKGTGILLDAITDKDLHIYNNTIHS